MEREWLFDFVHYLHQNLERQGLDHSHDTIEKILVEKMIKGATHERFRLYYAAKYRDNVELSLNAELLYFLSEIDLALAKFKTN